MRIVFILSALVLCLQSYSQLTISGKVVDSQTAKAIPYATIQFQGSNVGVSANSIGEFEITFSPTHQTSTLLISCLGYKSQRKYITGAQNDLLVKAARKEVTLDELVILDESLSAEEIMERAIGALKDNGPQEEYLLKMFYRHYCKENDKYGRLIEAAVDVYNPKGNKKIYNTPAAKVELKVNQLRRSFDFTQNFEEHDPISIYSTLKYDVSSYYSMLHMVPDQWNFSIANTTFYDGHLVYELAYNYQFVKNGPKQLTIDASGKIYINTSDYGILKITEEQSNEVKEEFQVHYYQMNWTVMYRKYQGHYYLSFAQETGHNTDELQNNDHDIIKITDHYFHVEMMTGNVQTVGIEKFKGHEPDADAMEEIEYDENFWNNYIVLKNSPVDDKIVKDLERRNSLKDQFDGGGQ